jgi:hypothetical protein
MGIREMKKTMHQSPPKRQFLPVPSVLLSSSSGFGPQVYTTERSNTSKPALRSHRPATIRSRDDQRLLSNEIHSKDPVPTNDDYYCKPTIVFLLCIFMPYLTKSSSTKNECLMPGGLF